MGGSGLRKQSSFSVWPDPLLDFGSLLLDFGRPLLDFGSPLLDFGGPLLDFVCFLLALNPYSLVGLFPQLSRAGAKQHLKAQG